MISILEGEKNFRETKQREQTPGLPFTRNPSAVYSLSNSLVLVLIFLSPGSAAMCPLFLTEFDTNSLSFLTHVTIEIH